MKKSILVIFLAVLHLFAFLRPAFTEGIGLYGSFGGGSLLFERQFDGISIFGIPKTTAIGCGIAVDTNLSGSDIFNYRFSLGYDSQFSSAKPVRRLNRAVMYHVFGAGLFRTGTIRFWMGPGLGVGYFWGRNVYVNRETYLIINNLVYFNQKLLTFSHLDVNLGISLGININVSANVTLPLEGGIRIHFYTNFGKMNALPTFTQIFPVISPEGYASFGVMYKINESADRDVASSTVNKKTAY
ncbi:MAG: hypothetical protein JW807_14425 [Spirochaetes bacterium]|nr:hypothetical protein [Spirochaetota bacterium]